MIQSGIAKMRTAQETNGTSEASARIAVTNPSQRGSTRVRSARTADAARKAPEEERRADEEPVPRPPERLSRLWAQVLVLVHRDCARHLSTKGGSEQKYRADAGRMGDARDSACPSFGSDERRPHASEEPEEGDDSEEEDQLPIQIDPSSSLKYARC